MDTQQLVETDEVSEKQVKEVADAGESLSLPLQVSTKNEKSNEARERWKLEQGDWKDQKVYRRYFFKLISNLATKSMFLLCSVIAAHMIIRFFNQNYEGVSDNVIQIIATSVFGQVLVIMGTLCVYLWKNMRH